MAQGALIEGGWLRSFREARSVDQFGDPVPWYTYSCTHILGQRLEGGMRVAFEFGSGLSTFWYAARARAVVAVEHDEGWAGSIGAQLPPNASIILEPEEDGYVAAIDDCGFST